MSFYVNLYTFTKEPNSTAQPAGAGTQYQCVSNTPFDVLHPSIPLNLSNAANPTAYNYCKIPDFQNRYYWIRTWTWEDGLWVAHCDVDPLASWKTSIGSTNAYVLRAAAASDGTIIDTMYPMDTAITSEKDTTNPGWVRLISQGSYVISIMGEGATQYYIMSDTALQNFLDYVLGPQYVDDVVNAWTASMVNGLEYSVDPLKYIGTIMWLPFNISTASTANVNIRVGPINVRATVLSPWPSYGILSASSINITLRKHPDAATRGSFMNSYASRYTLEFYPFGVFELDSAALAVASTLTLKYEMDLRTGIAIMTAYANDVLVANATAMMGISMQVSNIMQDRAVTGGVLGLLTSSFTAGMAGGPAGAVTGFISGIGDVAKKAQPHITTVGINAGQAGLCRDIVMSYEWKHLVDEDNTHRGRPLCQVRQLSTLSGYQLCTNVNVQAPATREELDAIRGYLESGYYYE